MKDNHILAWIHNRTSCKVIITMANKQCMQQHYCCVGSSNQPFWHVFSLKGIWHVRETVAVNVESTENDASERELE